MKLAPLSRMLSGALALGLIAAGGAHAADALCGLDNGKKATGQPILVGALVGKTGPDDLSSSAAAARAYFKCVNENGGINGRPIEYLIEDDKWNPESAAQAATKLVKDRKVVALVGSGSFVEMSVNAKLYEAEGVFSLASACAVRECFEAKNITSTNGGPLPSNLGAVQWAVKNLGTKSVVCIGLNIPSNGGWSCAEVVKWLQSKGLKGKSVLFDPGNADFTSVILEAVAANPDTMLTNLPSGAAVAVLKAAQDQNLRDKYKWISPTPMYDTKVPAALGTYWNGKVYVQAELTLLDGQGPDAKRWRAVLDKYSVGDSAASNRRDTFSQAGFISAKVFVDTLLKLDPLRIDRPTVTAAVRGIKNYRTDLMCGPFYVGNGAGHMPNHAGMMVQMIDGAFKTVAPCFDAESTYLDPIKAAEKRDGLVGL